MEILAAFFIFTIIVLTIFGSFHSVFSTSDAIKSGLDTQEMGQNCLNRMVLDLQSIHVALPPAYSPPGFDGSPDPYRIEGTEAESGDAGSAIIRFAARAHLPFDKTGADGIAEIIYYLHSSDRGGLVLRRADSLYPYAPFEPKAADPVLCFTVKSLSLKYYDADGTEHSTWDSESEVFDYATPRSIGIRLELGDENSSTRFETRVTLPVYRKKSG